MKYIRERKEIILDRELNELDNFVIDFCNLLEDYVLVSGYVSILFGRSRATEDVDLLIPKMSFNKFKEFWNRAIKNNFECLNTSNIKEAYQLINDHNIRFSRIGKPIPNMEFKLIQNDVHRYSFENKLKVIMKDIILFVSPLEMQIAYKLLLGKQSNTKDIEDAKHIYELFKENLDNKELKKLIKLLDSEKEFELIK